MSQPVRRRSDAAAVTTTSSSIIPTHHTPTIATTRRSVPDDRRHPSTGSPTIASLRREWAAIAADPASVAAVNGWQLTTISFDDLDDVLARCGHLGVGQTVGESNVSDAANTMVGALLCRAITDELAARIVLHRLLPGLIAVVRRRGNHPGELDELVSAAWTVIRTYNPKRQPRFFAATLLRDCEHAAFRGAGRRKWSSEAVEPNTFSGRAAPVAEQPSADELFDLITDARRAGVLDDADLGLLEAVLSDRPAKEIAAALQISERMLRYRKAELVGRLRRVAVAQLAA